MKFKKRANYRYIRLCTRISIGLVHRLLPTYPYSDPDVFQNVADSLPRRRQSFRRVL